MPTPKARPPLPPFNRQSAAEKVRMAENAWNLRDPQRVAAGYTEDSRWRNRAEFSPGANTSSRSWNESGAANATIA